jgi:hypothetical protein
MHLCEADRRDLAAFLARRLTTNFEPVDPRDLRDAAEESAWFDVLSCAEDPLTMRRITEKLAAARPHDAALREACRLLDGPRSSRESTGAALLVAGAATALGLAAVAVVGLASGLLLLDAAQGDQELTAFVAVSAPVAEGLPVPGDDRPGAEASMPMSDRSDRTSVVASRVEDGPPEVSPGPGARPLDPTVRGRDKCRGRPGEAVGYWYAGRLSPGLAGTSVVLDRSVYVRRELPAASNGWSARTKAVCSLVPGDKIVLRPAVELEGGHWWVPLFDGDVGGADWPPVASVD